MALYDKQADLLKRYLESRAAPGEPVPPQQRELEGQLVVAFEPMCKALWLRFRYSNSQHDDFRSDTYFGFLKALRSYDASRGQFSTHLYNCVQNQYCRRWTKYCNRRRLEAEGVPLRRASEHMQPVKLVRPVRNEGLLKMLAMSSPFTPREWDEDRAAQARGARLLEHILKRSGLLDLEQRTVMKLRFVEGLEYHDIARAARCSKQWVHCVIKKSLNTLAIWLRREERDVG